MSVDAGLTLNLAAQKGLRSIVDALLASRWRACDDGWWCVPAGEDVSEWRLVQGAERTQLDALVQAKMRAGEVFGILSSSWRPWRLGGSKFCSFQAGSTRLSL
ncbi:hypothetical protein WMF38_32105 [Sorangium sp. So ce118]